MTVDFTPGAPAQLNIVIDGVVVGKAAWCRTDLVWRAKVFRYAMEAVGLSAPPTWTAAPVEAPTVGGIRRAVREAVGALEVDKR